MNTTTKAEVVTSFIESFGAVLADIYTTTDGDEVWEFYTTNGHRIEIKFNSTSIRVDGLGGWDTTITDVINDTSLVGTD